jgi:SAM-dependent methyltransferase
VDSSYRSYAPAGHWDNYFRGLQESGEDLDWGRRWIDPFLPLLQSAQASRILELGCGSGNDAARLTDAGFSVTALDFSAVAIEQARHKHEGAATFVVHDMALPLPFRDDDFDAVMSNVALHMFDDGVTRSIMGEVARVVRPGGALLLHVNALEDRPLRERWRPVVRELAENFVLEEGGQTMHFFSEDYLRDLLRNWTALNLALIQIDDREGGMPFKFVWRAIARLPDLPFARNR